MTNKKLQGHVTKKWLPRQVMQQENFIHIAL